MSEIPTVPTLRAHRPLSRVVRAALVLLVVAQMLTLAGLGLAAAFIYQQQQYIEGRGEYRDREAERMEEQWQERFRRGQCDMLDNLPEGAVLDRLRDRYDCGPGLPRAELSPEERQELAYRMGAASAQEIPEFPMPTDLPPVPEGAVLPPCVSDIPRACD